MPVKSVNRKIRIDNFCLGDGGVCITIEDNVLRQQPANDQWIDTRNDLNPEQGIRVPIASAGFLLATEDSIIFLNRLVGGAFEKRLQRI